MDGKQENSVEAKTTEELQQEFARMNELFLEQITDVTPVFETSYEYNEQKYHSVVLTRDDYVQTIGLSGARRILEIPMILCPFDVSTEWLFSKFEIEDKENTVLTLCPGGFVDEITERDVRRYLGLLDLEKAELTTHLDPDVYDKASQNAPPNVVAYCVQFMKKIRTDKDKEAIINSWVAGLPGVLNITRTPDWWGRFITDVLDTLEVNEMHHRALGILDQFDRFLMKILIGTCYFFSTQHDSPYIEVTNDDGNDD